MVRLLLVDGHNLLFQMFFGMPARIVNHEGRAIQGTLGFVGALRRIIRRVEPSHVAVIFDGEHENDRAALDAGYKANRPDYAELPEEESPFSQLPDVYACLDVMGVAHAETLDCETDDVIAAYVRDTDCEVVIASFDSDFFQLISDRVSVLRYRGEQSVLCTPAWLREKYGIAPSQYADFKCLTGDSADNIPGVPHVGPKTAAWLLGLYGDLDGVLANAASIPKPAVRTAVMASAQRLRCNEQLIRLVGCAGIPFSMEEMAYRDTGMGTTEVLRAVGVR